MWLAPLAQAGLPLFALITAGLSNMISNVPAVLLLQHLVDAGLTDKVIRDQMLTMLIAGHDTSTALLAWTFALLGQHPETQAGVIQEVGTLDRSPLLDQVLYRLLLEGWVPIIAHPERNIVFQARPELLKK